MTNLLASYENILLARLKNDDKSAFTIIFTNYYPDLVRFSTTFTRNLDASEEIVQELFLKFWEDRDELVIHTSLKSHLLKSVQNRSLDWLRHLKVKDKYASMILDYPLLSVNDTENYVLHSELEMNFNQALTRLPGNYSEVYKMSRIENLAYHEIAEKLGISVRTVEDRISKALGLLRVELKDFLLLLVFIHQLFR